MNHAMSKPADPWRRHKLMAMPILVLVLAVMMYRNFLSSSVSPPATPPPLRTSRVPLISPSGISANATPKTEAKRWPKLELDKIVAKNPFGPWTSTDANTATALGQPIAVQSTGLHSTESGESSTRSGQTNTVPNDRVQALYHDAAGTAAIVDSRIIRPGDKLDNGLRIVNVTDDGVTVRQQQ